MEFERIKEFVVFSRYMNMTKAAQELLMTQSNMSKHIKQLEAELEFRLIERNGTRFTLTYQGERFLNWCHAMLDSYASIVDQCRKSQLVKRGSLVAQEPSYTDLVGEAYYRYIGELRNACPDVEVRYVRPYRKVLIDELESGRLDIGIMYSARARAGFVDEINAAGFIARSLAQDSLVIWCPETHSLASYDDVSFDDLATCRIIQPNDVYAPMHSVLMDHAARLGLHLRFNMVESDQAAMFLSMRYPDCVYVLPKSIQSDLRVTVRRDMVFKTIEHDSLTFSAYAVVRTSLFERFPEFKEVVKASLSGYLGVIDAIGI